MLTRVPLLVIALFVVAPLAAHTVPSMQNGSFDREILPWAATVEILPALEWSLADDANGSGGSRSLEIGIRPTSTATRTFFYQCIQIDERRVYEAGVRAFIPPDQPTGDVAARLAVRWYGNNECSGDPLPRFLPVFSVTKPGVWNEARLRQLTPAPGATHAAFSIEVTRTSTAVSRARARFDDAYFVPVEGRLIIPAVASLAGAGNSFWSSDLYVINSTDAPVHATLLYRCSSASGTCSLKPGELTIPAGESIFIPNAASDMFDSPNSSGAVEIFHNAGAEGLVATSRLNSRALRGTFGAEVPALRDIDLARTTLLAGLRNSSDFRTNVGIYNASDLPVSVELTLFFTGVRAGRTTVVVNPRSSLQMNAFAALDSAHLLTDNAYIRVEATEPIAAFASVIDNATNDVAFSTGVKLP